MDDRGFALTVDCTGASRIGEFDGLRGVRGEMAYLQTDEVTLSRPVRMLHPRIPLYIVPRGGGLFMCGATMIESDDAGPITTRSLMELLNAAYSLHPAFAERAWSKPARACAPLLPTTCRGPGAVKTGLPSMASIGTASSSPRPWPGRWRHWPLAKRLLEEISDEADHQRRGT